MNNKHDEITCFAKNCVYHKGETTCCAVPASRCGAGSTIR